MAKGTNGCAMGYLLRPGAARDRHITSLGLGDGKISISVRLGRTKRGGGWGLVGVVVR